MKNKLVRELCTIRTVPFLIKAKTLSPPFTSRHTHGRYLLRRSHRVADKQNQHGHQEIDG
ncbi:MAG: hypothetical protein ACLTC4_08745 [Hungatella hathewayi]